MALYDTFIEVSWNKGYCDIMFVEPSIFNYIKYIKIYLCIYIIYIDICIHKLNHIDTNKKVPYFLYTKSFQH